MFLFLRFTHQKWLVFHDRTYNYSFLETYLKHKNILFKNPLIATLKLLMNYTILSIV